jgi:hypothetical protein
MIDAMHCLRLWVRAGLRVSVRNDALARTTPCMHFFVRADVLAAVLVPQIVSSVRLP